jgi:hypothetical protein
MVTVFGYIFTLNIGFALLGGIQGRIKPNAALVI